MVSWHRRPSSPAIFRRPAICSGDQQSFSFSTTWVRRRGSRTSLRCRRRRRLALSSAATSPSAVLGGDGVVSAVLLHLAELVAGDLAVDGGAVPAELACDLVDRQLGVEQAEERAPLLEGEVPIGSVHAASP